MFAYPFIINKISLHLFCCFKLMERQELIKSRSKMPTVPGDMQTNSPTSNLRLRSQTGEALGPFLLIQPQGYSGIQKLPAFYSMLPVCLYIDSHCRRPHAYFKPRI